MARVHEARYEPVKDAPNPQVARGDKVRITAIGHPRLLGGYRQDRFDPLVDVVLTVLLAYESDHDQRIEAVPPGRVRVGFLSSYGDRWELAAR